MEVIGDSSCFVRYDIESWLGRSSGDEGYLTKIFGSILCAEDEEDEDGVVCGHIRACHLRCRDMIDNDEFHPRKWGRADSGELAEIARAIYRINGSWTPEIHELLGPVEPEDMMVISEVELHPNYRGRGVGLKAIERTICIFGSSCGIAALCPWPFEVKDPGDEQEDQRAHVKLANYSERIGFKQLGDSRVWVRSLMRGSKRTAN